MQKFPCGEFLFARSVFENTFLWYPKRLWHNVAHFFQKPEGWPVENPLTGRFIRSYLSQQALGQAWDKLGQELLNPMFTVICMSHFRWDKCGTVWDSGTQKFNHSAYLSTRAALPHFPFRDVPR